jgi:hypothetical protein
MKKLKHVKLFENFEYKDRIFELRGSEQTIFYNFLEKEFKEFSRNIDFDQNLDSKVKNFIIESIIQFYDIKYNNKNISKINKSFDIKIDSDISTNPSFFREIVHSYYFYDKNNEYKLIDIVDEENLSDSHDYFKKLINKSSMRLPVNLLKKWYHKLYEGGYRGGIYQDGLNKIVDVVYKLFPKEVKNKEENKDFDFYLKTGNLEDELSKKIYDCEFTISSLEKIFNDYLVDNADDDLYSKIKLIDIEKLLSKLKSYIQHMEEYNIEFIDDKMISNYTYLSKYISMIKNICIENNIISKSDKMYEFLNEIIKWLKNN